MWLKELIPLAMSFIGGGALSTLLYVKLNKRQKTAEVIKAEIDVEKIQDEYQRESIKAAFQQLEDVQQKLNKTREELFETTQKLAETKLELVKMTERAIKAETDKCEVIGCPNRIPPR